MNCPTICVTHRVHLGMMAGDHFPRKTVLPSKQRMRQKCWFFKKKTHFFAISVRRSENAVLGCFQVHHSRLRISVIKYIPSMICFMRRSDNVPINSPNCDLSTVKIWETKTTLCLGKFASPFSRSTFPGVLARFILEVSAHTITVLILLALKTLF